MMEKSIKKADSVLRTVKSYLSGDNKLEKVDKIQLEILHSSLIQFYEAQDDLNERGFFVKNRFDEVVQNPAIKVSTDAKVQINKCIEFMKLSQKLRYKDLILSDSDSILDKLDDILDA